MQSVSVLEIYIIKIVVQYEKNVLYLPCSEYIKKHTLTNTNSAARAHTHVRQDNTHTHKHKQCGKSSHTHVRPEHTNTTHHRWLAIYVRNIGTNGLREKRICSEFAETR